MVQYHRKPSLTVDGVSSMQKCEKLVPSAPVLPKQDTLIGLKLALEYQIFNSSEVTKS
jgi:hypothetical protein